MSTRIRHALPPLPKRDSNPGTGHQWKLDEWWHLGTWAVRSRLISAGAKQPPSNGSQPDVHPGHVTQGLSQSLLSPQAKFQGWLNLSSLNSGRKKLMTSGTKAPCQRLCWQSPDMSWVPPSTSAPWENCRARATKWRSSRSNQHIFKVNGGMLCTG